MINQVRNLTKPFSDLYLYRCETLTFQYPMEDFRRRLLESGGVGVIYLFSYRRCLYTYIFFNHLKNKESYCYLGPLGAILSEFVVDLFCISINIYIYTFFDTFILTI